MFRCISQPRYKIHRYGILQQGQPRGRDKEEEVHSGEGSHSYAQANYQRNYGKIDLIQELHSKKIAHRDIKCANILLHNSEVKIGDLGLSKELMIMNDEDTSANTILGTG